MCDAARGLHRFAGDLSITIVELSAQLGSYRRGRRAFVAKVFNQCFDFIHRTGVSATQVFSRVDVDGSGELDVLEFQESMRRMGQSLTSNQAAEVMAAANCMLVGRFSSAIYR
jgi:hypothetical protein